MKNWLLIMLLMLIPMMASAQSTYKQYIKAAKKGDADAQYRIGSCYSKGSGVERDEEKAVSWWRKAAEQGHAISQGLLGYAYDKGEGVKKNPSLAVFWYRKAAEQDVPLAQTVLAMCYNSGKGVQKDEVQAVYWFRKAAQQGFLEAQYWMGLCYSNGWGVDKDEVQALNWYRIAADQGHAGAQGCVGYCYLEGIGVPKDNSQAVSWLQKSVKNGDSKANTYLAVAKKKMQEQAAEEKAHKQAIADSIARVYEVYEDPEWKSKAKIDQHYSTLLYESDFPYIAYEKYDKSTRFLVRSNDRSGNGIYGRITVKVQGGGRNKIEDLNNCFVRFKSFRSGSISTRELVKALMTFETDDGTTLTYECKSNADCIRLPYLFNVKDVEIARIVLIGTKVWGTRDTRFPYAPLTIIGVGIGKSTKYQHEILLIDSQGEKHSIQANLSLTNALTLEDEDNQFIDHYKFSDPEKAFPRIPKSDWNLIRQSRIRIGMSKDACRLSWGEPDDINTSRGRWGVHEQWVYSRNRYVYFENGKLSAIQD